MKLKKIISIVLIFSLCLPAITMALDVQTLVIFGDSLSDTGNLYALDPSQVPEQDYYQGRFSNGPVWVEYLADTQYLDCDLINNAYAGATTDGDDTVPGLISQVNDFIDSTTIESNMLFAIWIGANDFLDGSVDFQKSADNIGLALADLGAAGAQEILIINLPDIGETPALSGTLISPLATFLTQQFNNALADVIDSFKAQYPDINVYEFDAYALLQDIIDTPEAYGFNNVSQVCPSFNEADNFDNSAGYLFWDLIHPTTEAHKEFANQIISILPVEAEQISNDELHDNQSFIELFHQIFEQFSDNF
ncbi:MAG: SGNH/GDSL hydrolase family protein [Desulfobacteraceae bacterium]|nr:SGNH/GDSL hydrolase family protein [Desulfobacteraceae bacterium]